MDAETKGEFTAAVVEGILKLLLVGGSLTAAMIIPNALIGLEKPIVKILDRLDRRDQQRELRRILRYMKRADLVATLKDYDHGIKITKKGRIRLQKLEFNSIKIPRPQKWDKKWRLVFYDIPENHKAARDTLTRKLKALGFYQLQRSVFVHPYPCHDEIAVVSQAYDVNKYVSYIETGHIDQEKLLIKKFRQLTSI